MWLWSQNLLQRFLQFLCGVKLLFLLPLFHPPSVFYQSFAWRGSANLSVFLCQTSDLTNYLAISGHFKNFFFFISNLMLTPPSTSGGRGTRSYFEKNHLLISLMMGPISKLVVSYMCFINNSFMLRFISKLVVGSGLIHFSSPIWKFFDLSPHFISSSLLDSAAAVFIQFVPVGHLLSFFHFCPYFLSYCVRFLIQEHFFPSTRDAQLLMSWPRK